MQLRSCLALLAVFAAHASAQDETGDHGIVFASGVSSVASPVYSTFVSTGTGDAGIPLPPGNATGGAYVGNMNATRNMRNASMISNDTLYYGPMNLYKTMAGDFEVNITYQNGSAFTPQPTVVSVLKKAYDAVMKGPSLSNDTTSGNGSTSGNDSSLLNPTLMVGPEDGAQLTIVSLSGNLNASQTILLLNSLNTYVSIFPTYAKVPEFDFSMAPPGGDAVVIGAFTNYLLEAKVPPVGNNNNTMYGTGRKPLASKPPPADADSDRPLKGRFAVRGASMFKF